MENKKRLAINMISVLVAFGLNMIINFFLSPYIIENVGVDAYGFVSLANNFVMYASILTIALNSMAGRFITVSIYKEDNEETNKYFSSVLIVNYVASIVLLIPIIFLVIFLDKILNIPIGMITDTKFLFAFIFLNFLLNIINSTYSIATFAMNRLDLSSRRNIDSSIIKAILLFILFTFLSPRISYIGIATCAMSLYLLIWNIRYTKKLLPQIKISCKYFEISKIIEIIKSGIWNTITKLGQTLSDGLDLLICNLFINSETMGQLSIAKTFSAIVSNLLATVSNVFSPQITIDYAKNEIDKLINNVKMSMKVTGCFANIPLSYLLVFGAFFYTTWIPNQDIKLISILTILTVQGEIISGAITPLFNIFTVSNKVKVDAIVRLCTGFITVAIVFVFVKFTNLGIYAVAGTSIVLGTLVNLIFVPIYVSKKCLNIKWYTFYPIILRYILTTVILIIVLILFVRPLFKISNWINIIISVFVVGIVGLCINILLLFSNKEKKEVLNTIKNRITNKNN